MPGFEGLRGGTTKARTRLTAAIPNLSWAEAQATALMPKYQVQGAFRTVNRFVDPFLRPAQAPSCYDTAKFGIAGSTPRGYPARPRRLRAVLAPNGRGSGGYTKEILVALEHLLEGTEKRLMPKRRGRYRKLGLA